LDPKKEDIPIIIEQDPFSKRGIIRVNNPEYLPLEIQVKGITKPYTITRTKKGGLIMG